MVEDEGTRWSPTAKEVYQRKRLPRKFCPYCGHKNEPENEECSRCGKDISWIKIPEHVPFIDTPPEKPRKLPEQRKALSRRAVIIIVIAVLLIIAAVIVIAVLASGNGGSSRQMVASSAAVSAVCAGTPALPEAPRAAVVPVPPPL